MERPPQGVGENDSLQVIDSCVSTENTDGLEIWMVADLRLSLPKASEDFGVIDPDNDAHGQCGQLVNHSSRFEKVAGGQATLGGVQVVPLSGAESVHQHEERFGIGRFQAQRAMSDETQDTPEHRREIVPLQ